jgi:UDP-2,4-diacetamido-2,4,6-trideoxy-beta-L-altropyranose hydrolase/UDP-4-amino-4,6-dideoxy-N-acetyl-beta-L-altrosamine N-acetyltransferase
MNILIRADSSSQIGTGHIMRDLVLAKRFKDSNIIFATRNLAGNINHKITEAGYVIENLESNKIEELDNIIKKRNIDMIVIDNYDIDYAYETQLKLKNPNLKIMVLDDTYEKHNCDILLNHNFCADKSKYKDLVPEHCELQCGTKYTLLREEFILEKEKKRERLSNKVTVFIAMGGSDHSNLNVKILEVLSEFKDKIKAIVVTTSANKNLSELMDFVEDKNWIDLQINSDRIAYLMNISDFAIVTPSVTINEVMFMELPFIAIKTAENQNEIFNYLKNNHHLCLRKFNSHILYQYLLILFDIAKYKFINYINMDEKESKMILNWRNQFSVRKWMINREIIDYSSHKDFINRLKNSKQHQYFLIKSDEQYIGSVNFKLVKMNRVEMGIFANPSLKGMGQSLMNLIVYHSFVRLNKDIIISEVFSGNKRAIKLYKNNHFKNISKKTVNNSELLHLELTYEDWKEKYQQ